MSIVSSLLSAVRRRLLGDWDSRTDQILMLLGQAEAERLHEVDDVRLLGDVEFSVYSQWGEDGIIEWLCQRLPLLSTRFIEFGVGDYRESNTRFLLRNRNWRGLVIDSSAGNVESIQRDEIYWKHDLTAVHSFVTRDNIDELISRHGFEGHIGILSIDIDGNDYWIWDAIDVAKPDVVICEYNAVFGDIHSITIPYVEDFDRLMAHSSGLYFGASIAALESMAAKRGYQLLGSNQAGNNAFFVRSGLFSLLKDRVGETEARPSLFRESRGPEGGLTHLQGMQRLQAIDHTVVTNISTGQVVQLGSLNNLYSPDWLRAMAGEASVGG